nr:hypothetical protein [Tanacetum cinerariifolium]
MAKDVPILTTMRFIPKHETVQKYGAILPDTLTNQAMKESDAYKTYYDLATRKEIPKPKYVRQSTRERTDQAPKASPRKRLIATSKVAKSGKKKLLAQGLETLSEIALFEAEQMKFVTKRSKTDYHVSYDSGSKSSDDENDDKVSKNVDNEDDDDHDDDNANKKHDDEKLDEEEEGFDQGFHTPSHFESTDDEAYDEVTQGDNVEEEKLDEEKTNKEEEVNELYNDMNINLEGRDTKMTDALLANVQATQVIEDTHSSSVSLGFISKMLNPNPDLDILATYGDTTTTKRRRDDEDNDEEPSAGSNRGSKRRRSKKESESSSEPKEKSSKSTGKSVEGSRSH